MNRTRVMMTQTITCPECGKRQEGQVTYTEGDPWCAYVHYCECGYIITESEWGGCDGPDNLEDRDE